MEAYPELHRSGRVGGDSGRAGSTGEVDPPDLMPAPAAVCPSVEGAEPGRLTGAGGDRGPQKYRRAGRGHASRYRPEASPGAVADTGDEREGLLVREVAPERRAPRPRDVAPAPAIRSRVAGPARVGDGGLERRLRALQRCVADRGIVEPHRVEAAAAGSLAPTAADPVARKDAHAPERVAEVGARGSPAGGVVRA